MTKFKHFEYEDGRTTNVAYLNKYSFKDCSLRNICFKVTIADGSLVIEFADPVLNKENILKEAKLFTEEQYAFCENSDCSGEDLELIPDNHNARIIKLVAFSPVSPDITSNYPQTPIHFKYEDGNVTNTGYVNGHYLDIAFRGIYFKVTISNGSLTVEFSDTESDRFKSRIKNNGIENQVLKLAKCFAKTHRGGFKDNPCVSGKELKLFVAGDPVEDFDYTAHLDRIFKNLKLKQ